MLDPEDKIVFDQDGGIWQRSYITSREHGSESTLRKTPLIRKGNIWNNEVRLMENRNDARVNFPGNVNNLEQVVKHISGVEGAKDISATEAYDPENEFAVNAAGTRVAMENTHVISWTRDDTTSGSSDIRSVILFKVRYTSNTDMHTEHAMFVDAYYYREFVDGAINVKLTGVTENDHFITHFIKYPEGGGGVVKINTLALAKAGKGRDESNNEMRFLSLPEDVVSIEQTPEGIILYKEGGGRILYLSNDQLTQLENQEPGKLYRLEGGRFKEIK